MTGSAERIEYLGVIPRKTADKVLDGVETVFSDVLSEGHKERNITPSLERYRQDEIEVTFSWVGQDSISRNIQAWATGSSEPELKLSVLAHAWRDEEEQDRGGTRRSHYDQIGTLDIPFGRLDVERLKEVLERANATVSSWGEEDLTQTSPFQPTLVR